MSREPHAATIGRELQGEPTDPRALAVVSDHDDGRMLAQWLSASGAGWRTWADRIAGHVVSLGIAPNGRARALAEDVPWNWVPPPGAWMATRRAGWSGIVWPKSRAGRAADDLSLVLQRLQRDQPGTRARVSRRQGLKCEARGWHRPDVAPAGRLFPRPSSCRPGMRIAPGERARWCVVPPIRTRQQRTVGP